MSNAAALLASVREKGATIWVEDGELRYKVRKGVLSREEMERLRQLRSEIVAHLQTAEDAQSDQPGAESGALLASIPLSFPQLSHWTTYRLHERSSIRQIAAAMRLRGRLDLDSLRKAIASVVARHDALRSRIVLVNGVPLQEIRAAADCKLEYTDLTGLPADSEEGHVKRLIAEWVMQPVNLATDPLFAVLLLRLRDDEHVLLLAIEHMVSDAFSLGIVIQDLCAAYARTVTGEAIRWPKVAARFGEHVLRQRNTVDALVAKHRDYWNERWLTCDRLRFPYDPSPRAQALSGWQAVPVSISNTSKLKLREWCRLQRTTLAMSVFTAYVALVLRWCNASRVVMRYQSDGRFSPGFESTVGYFASELYLRIDLRESDSFTTLLRQVTDEYCKAHEHADLGYLAAQVPRPDFTRNSIFNWVPAASTAYFSALHGSQHALDCSRVRFDHPMIDTLELDVEPFILLTDTDEEIIGDLYFPRDRFSVGTMNRFARAFMACIDVMLERPAGRVHGIEIA